MGGRARSDSDGSGFAVQMWLYHTPETPTGRSQVPFPMQMQSGETADGDGAAQLGVSRCFATLGMHKHACDFGNAEQ